MKIRFEDIVTNGQWKQYDPAFSFPDGEENKPRTNVTHMEAMQYAAWLSVQTGKRFRLPTVDEMKEAEATFVLNTTFYPLQQCPDVGTCGVNADGVRDLWGLVYQWTANDGDVERARAQWKSTPKPQVVVGSLAEFLASLEAKRAKLDTELKELAAFLKFVGNFSNE